MLRFLSGKVHSVFENLVVLNVGGFGFELPCTGRGAALCTEGEPATLVTYLQFSEAGPTLFGFADERERALFLKLTTVKGVGGKMAMNILKAAPPERIVSWILSSDVNSMVKIPGIGRKTAERLCFEMRPHLVGEDAELPAEGYMPAGKKSGDSHGGASFPWICSRGGWDGLSKTERRGASRGRRSDGRKNSAPRFEGIEAELR